ncbi:MAG: TAXI family TRAP transporter solute-binding subunit [Desulfarculaceae bacterium]|nr:TAXI family TRAP transporter solute-binding subunit [Desulfarculaceae bacterium]
MSENIAIAIPALFSVANHFGKQVLEPPIAAQASGSVHREPWGGQIEMKRADYRITWIFPKLRVLTAAACLTALVFLLPAWAAPALAGTTLVMGTGSAGSPYHRFGQTFANIVNQSSAKTGIRIKVVASIGSVDNIKGLLSGRFQLALSQADVAQMAWAGKGPWAKAGPQKSLRTIYDIYTEGMTCVATVASGIKTAKDLRGKRVALGERDSGTLVNAVQALSLGLLKPSDLGQTLYVGPDQAMRLMYDGKLDAFFYMVGHPSVILKKFLAHYGKARVVPFRLSSAMKNEIPYYVPYFIWKRDYPGLRNPLSKTDTFGIETFLMTTDKIPSEVTYEVFRMFLLNLKDLKARLPFMYATEAPTKKNFKVHVWNVSAPYHTGITQLMKEMGVIDSGASPVQ